MVSDVRRNPPTFVLDAVETKHAQWAQLLEAIAAGVTGPDPATIVEVMTSPSAIEGSVLACAYTRGQDRREIFSNNAHVAVLVAM